MNTLWRFSAVLVCGVLALFAEDFWVKKSYTEWSAKDASKLLQHSPWAAPVSLSTGRASDAMSGGGGGRGGRGGGDMNSGMNGGDMGAASGEMGGGRGGRGRRGESDMSGPVAPPSLTMYVRWQSALPVRRALVIEKFGREGAESDEAKKFLDQVVPAYVVGIIGVPPAIGRIPSDRLNEMAKKSTALVRKDKDPIAAENTQLSAHEKSMDLYFVFSKTSAITLDDKEVEFISKMGPIEIKRKFKLKDMVVGDKLEL